jgi:hypothetical protein
MAASWMGFAIPIDEARRRFPRSVLQQRDPCLVMPDLIRHPPFPFTRAAKEDGPRIKSGVTISV